MKLAFLGAGKMATAIASGVSKTGVIPTEDIVACDISLQAREAFTSTTGISCSDFDAAVFAECDVLILAVKPQYAKEAVRPLAALRPEQLVISIAAGLPIATLSSWLGTGRIIRVMPNTPLMVGVGASAYARGPGATDADAALVGRIFGASGYACEVGENHMDAVTALSGSGPAYIFEMIQAMVDGAVAVGLPQDLALRLAVQTTAGAAEMLCQELGSPDELRTAVTSPGGTTAAGLSVMADANFRGTIADTIRAARDRSVELGKGEK